MYKLATNDIKPGKIPSTFFAVAAMVALGLCSTANATFKSLAAKLPASSNAIVAVNVEKVLNTPYAKSEWAPNTIEAWAKQPVMIAPGSTRLLTAAEVRSDTMESFWEMALMEMQMGKMPALETLAKSEGGSIDRVWDKDAVCSPVNAYFIPLDGTILASVTPANRTGIAKWIRTVAAKPEGGVTSEYIQKVLAGLGDSTDIVMALDLEGAFGVPRIRRFLDDNDIKEIKEADRDAAAGTLGSMKGITLAVTIDQDATGKATVEFDRDPAMLGASAKSIMMDVLDTAGMHIEDVKDWTVATVGKTITLEGKLSTPSLRRLLSIIQSPIPAATVAQAPAAGQGDAPADPVVASQRYYKAICAMLDGFKAATSASASAGWARATSKRIDQLPILNVDPQLVQWGSNVSLKLKQAGAGMGIAQTQMNARVAGVMDPAYSAGNYDSYGEYHAAIPKGEMENANRQRRQAALEQKAQAQEQAARVLNEIAETRPAIRSAMVDKYKVEF